MLQQIQKPSTRAVVAPLRIGGQPTQPPPVPVDASPMKTTGGGNKPSADRPDPVSTAPAWIDKAVVYGALVPRFGKPPLRALTAHLDYLRSLGVNTLWVSPVTPTTDATDYGYEATSLEGVRPDYGTPADMKRLVREAHARDMKVLLDVVVNHTSVEHPWALDVDEYGRDSSFYDHYDRNASGEPTHYFDWTHLPNLNFDNPKVRTAVSDSLAKWVKEYDVDGFRVDAAWGVQKRRPDFWPQVRARLQELKPDIALVAEASARDPYWFANGFDVAYDWHREVGSAAWADAFAGATVSLPALRRALTETQSRTANASGGEVLRFLNNNDTGERLVSRHGIGVARAAAGMLMTLPGVPVIYTGDEIGAKFLPYQSSRVLDFRRNPKLREHYAKLAQLRQQLPALRSNEMAQVETPAPKDILAYRRGGDAAEAVYVLVNFSPRTHTVPVQPGTLRDELSGETFAGTADARTAVKLGPHAVRVLRATDTRPAPDAKPEPDTKPATAAAAATGVGDAPGDVSRRPRHAAAPR